MKMVLVTMNSSALILVLAFSFSLVNGLVSPEAIEQIRHGQVSITHGWLPPDLTKSLKKDAQFLFQQGHFRPDGLTNTALSKNRQGFSAAADRQTFRGGAGWNDNEGNLEARQEFAKRMRELRLQLARGLDRPTLATERTVKHEMTFNWYEPGAKLGRHLDEHHEETKGLKGWMLPTRRSVTWLVYLNDGWLDSEGGALRTFPRETKSTHPVGSHNGNLQVGWLNKNEPVFLDAFRPSGGSALYKLNDNSSSGTKILSVADFDVPRQPIDFSAFLEKQHRTSFEQISTARLDPRFAATSNKNDNTQIAKLAKSSSQETVLQQQNDGHHLDIVPAAGTLVLFDSVTLPHLVRDVTGTRQRIAATGWFHEDSCFSLEEV
ncbi:2OG-Fe(II) oxygenase [Seminavis robusta]|uniref:2OG-Fe(II) oxygenase n=1 Tax=Seminavis robusta TaxID=568900 RepID=A0A9N8D8V4_9STRA|nr:2OG-Fe(II) oxygenase [Seminavis robusta]|eukprot:Sro4_g003390.1 2OG-Fe(II) oxygenase (377) ;mRNA; r:137352-138482